MGRTYDADSGADLTSTVTPGAGAGTMASVINIPPQIAVTLCWVALGFVIAWYFMRKTGGKEA